MPSPSPVCRSVAILSVMSIIGSGGALCPLRNISVAGEPTREYPLEVPLRHRKDLTHDLDADRALSPSDLALLLELSQFLIDKSNDRYDRATAADDLGRLGHSYAVPALLAVIRDEKDIAKVRSRCVWALSVIKDKRNVEFIIDEAIGGDLYFNGLSNLVRFVGRPPELKNSSWWAGVTPPPGDPKEREAYLEIWRQWWKKNRDKIELNRTERGGFF